MPPLKTGITFSHPLSPWEELVYRTFLLKTQGSISIPELSTTVHRISSNKEKSLQDGVGQRQTLLRPLGMHWWPQADKLCKYRFQRVRQWARQSWSCQFSSVVQSCPTLCDPMDCSLPGLPVHHQPQSSLKLMSIKSVMPSSHLILCFPLLLPLIFPSIRVFSNESALRIRWPKYWSFSFSINPSNEYSGLISFRMGSLDLLAVQGTLKSFLQHHSSKFFSAQLSLVEAHWLAVEVSSS